MYIHFKQTHSKMIIMMFQKKFVQFRNRPLFKNVAILNIVNHIVNIMND